MKITETKITELSRRDHEQRTNVVLITRRISMTIADKEEEPETFITFQVDVEHEEFSPFETIQATALLRARKLLNEQYDPIEARRDNLK